MMKVLFVCTANVCRSPLAEGYLKTVLEKNGQSADVDVFSAGVHALSGAAAFDCAVEVGRLFGFDLSHHRAQQLTISMAQKADSILCMETWQAREVTNLIPESTGRISLLGRFHRNQPPLFQISDPRDFTIHETLRTFDLIKESVEGFLTTLYL